MKNLIAIVVLAVLSLTAAAQSAEGVRKPRRLVLCLDGTWNSAFSEHTRRDKHTVLRPTNALKLCRAVVPVDGDVEQIVFYDVGVGSLAQYPGAANRVLRFTDRLLGGAWGAGFEANIESALHFLAMNYEPGDEIFIFGFSRGAATARSVTGFLEWSHGLPPKRDAYYLPLFFRQYVLTHGEPGEAEKYLQQINSRREADESGDSRTAIQPFRPVRVKYLGLWDTVMALGARFKATGENTSTASKTFYAGKKLASSVEHARQALAIDEARFDFRPEVWIGPHPGQDIEQRWFAGVHSNIGGGYLPDGLANIALAWIIEGAKEQHLATDDAYLAHFPGKPQSTLFDSSSTLYHVLEAVRFRKGQGKRPIRGENADLDVSVLQRMQMDASQIEPKKPYRPENVLEFLACQSDLDAYVRRISNGELTAASIPADARTRIEQLRPRCSG
jgi:uncharacterized protein (DUF2235 family)